MTDIERTRVLDLIAAYGGDPARWPAAEQEAAVARLSGDAELARAADDARLLDLALDTLPHPHPNPALRVRLKEIPEPGAGLFDLIGAWVGLWRPAAGLAAAAVLGIAIGAANPDLPLPGFTTPSVAGQSAETIEADTVSLAAASAAGFTAPDTF